jgi:hypothetical protein
VNAEVTDEQLLQLIRSAETSDDDLAQLVAIAFDHCPKRVQRGTWIAARIRGLELLDNLAISSEPGWLSESFSMLETAFSMLPVTGNLSWGDTLYPLAGDTVVTPDGHIGCAMHTCPGRPLLPPTEIN